MIFRNFNIEDVFSPSDIKQAEKYIGKKGYYANDIELLDHCIDTKEHIDTLYSIARGNNSFDRFTPFIIGNSFDNSRHSTYFLPLEKVKIEDRINQKDMPNDNSLRMWNVNNQEENTNKPNVKEDTKEGTEEVDTKNKFKLVGFLSKLDLRSYTSNDKIIIECTYHNRMDKEEKIKFRVYDYKQIEMIIGNRSTYVSFLEKLIISQSTQYRYDRENRTHQIIISLRLGDPIKNKGLRIRD